MGRRLRGSEEREMSKNGLLYHGFLSSQTATSTPLEHMLSPNFTLPREVLKALVANLTPSFALWHLPTLSSVKKASALLRVVSFNCYIFFLFCKGQFGIQLNLINLLAKNLHLNFFYARLSEIKIYA